MLGFLLDILLSPMFLLGVRVCCASVSVSTDITSMYHCMLHHFLSRRLWDIYKLMKSLGEVRCKMQGLWLFHALRPLAWSGHNVCVSQDSRRDVFLSRPMQFYNLLPQVSTKQIRRVLDTHRCVRPSYMLGGRLGLAPVVLLLPTSDVLQPHGLQPHGLAEGGTVDGWNAHPFIFAR